ncbi:MAG: hypothetical protein ABIS35_05535 [Terracoccus sp.]
MGTALPDPQHPTIPPWLRPIARRRGEVQFGVLEGGPIVTGLGATEVAALALLDGSRSAEAAQRSARRAGVPAARWRSLLDLLRRLEVLDDGTASPSRAGAPSGSTATRHVVVDGVGELSGDIAALLRRSGIGRVSHGRPLVDLVVSDPVRHDPALVVIVSATALDPQRGDLWLEHDVPHLPVVSSGRRATVGPLVHDRGGPCLWCLDLHRTDHDDAWPALMAQLCGSDPMLAPAPAPPESEPSLSQLVAGSVGLFATHLLRGDRPPSGVSVEVSTPWPRMDHRRWRTHPRCRRHGRPDGAPPARAAA